MADAASTEARLTVADVLERAADRCAKAGAWCQGAGGRDQFGRDVRESKCVPVSRWMLGHASDVCVSDAAADEGSDIWNDLLQITASICGGAPAGWNDAPGRTQAEVVAKLREAAAIARASGK
jgi:hypothetical protein